MIYLIRHGQTEFNVQGRMQGRLDSPLTGLGVEQARRMAEHLRGHLDDPELWTVVSSPLGRARRTAEIVCETLGLGCGIELDDRLAEFHMGEWEGLTREDLAATDPGLAGQPFWWRQAPGAEPFEAVAERLGAWLAKVDQGDGRRRLVVSHGGTGAMLRNVYAGIEGDARLQPSPPQDAVFRLFRGMVERIDLMAVSEGQAGAAGG